MMVVLREHLTKVCPLLLLVAVGLCTVMVIPTSPPSNSVRSRLIPRYLFEKEIRGPNYHAVKRIFENDGFRSLVKTITPEGQAPSFGKFQLRRRQESNEPEVSAPVHTIHRVARFAPAHPKPFIST